MKTLIYVLSIGFMLFLISGCSEDGTLFPADMNDPAISALKSAKKPIPILIGEQECNIDLGGPLLFDCTVNFGTYGTYAITFIPHGPPRDFSQASIFEEDVIIYYLDSDWTDPENVVLIGLVNGTHTLANRPPEPSRFVSNGKVFEAYGPLEAWEGCNLFVKGTFYWTPGGMPDRVECIFRIN